MKHFCREASQLASDAFERDLNFRERFRLRLHMTICGMCRVYASNLRLLNKLLSIKRDQTNEGETCLSDEDRKQIETALNKATDHNH